LSKTIFSKTLIIGLGLIGGSFAKALRQNKISEKIFAFDLDLEAIDFAKNIQAIDGGADNFLMLDENFDLIVIATPLLSYEEIFDEIATNILPKTTIIDLGSLKSFIAEILPKNLIANFIGCHPIAGSEKIGFENSDSKLFLDKKFIICPTSKNDPLSIKKIENIAKEIGCNVDIIEPKKHDEIYALVSHLPQFLSFLTKEFSPKNIKDEFFKTAYRLDFSSPEIWSDIFELNDANMEKFYIEFFENLEKEISLFKADSSISTANNALPDFIKTGDDLTFFEENFAEIFARAFVVKSYLNLPQINDFKKYAGKGFEDFSSIISIFNYEEILLADLVSKNRKKIIKILNSLL